MRAAVGENFKNYDVRIVRRYGAGNFFASPAGARNHGGIMVDRLLPSEKRGPAR